MKSTDRSSSTSSSKRQYDSTRRQAQAEERRQRVIDAAVELFLDQGYGPTTIDQIAKAADVSTQSVYASFDGKAGILEQAVHLLRTGSPWDVMLDGLSAWLGILVMTKMGIFRVAGTETTRSRNRE